MYADAKSGPCPHTGYGLPQCQDQYGMKTCVYSAPSPYGANQETVDRLQANTVAAMWGGKGHNEAHAIYKGTCMQMTGPKVSGDKEKDHHWRANVDHWAK